MNSSLIQIPVYTPHRYFVFIIRFSRGREIKATPKCLSRLYKSSHKVVKRSVLGLLLVGWKGGVVRGVVDCGVQGGKGLVWNQFTPVFVGTRLPV